MTIRRLRYMALALALGVSGAMGSYLLPAVARAADAGSWRSGEIIDDAIFTDKDSMNVQQIQDFLNSKVGTGFYGRVAGQCDTNGQGTSELGGGTRAQWAAARSLPTTFTCLKDYYEIPKTSPGATIPANNYGGKAIPAGAISAAQIIYNAAQQYRISPKVLLVTLHKESAGPLTTDDWPTEKQYTYAMGSHCFDSTGCDANYAGFSMQMYEGANQLRGYLDNMNQPWWPYRKLGANDIKYNPTSSCGSSTVQITSSATAALYTYTPYQPNAAAMANLYGNGDSCSAYGNRNFWRIFSDWFGSTRISTLPGCPEATNTSLSCIWHLTSPTGQPYYTSSVPVRDNLTGVNGYQFQSRLFFGNVIVMPGNIPVYRLEDGAGGSFLTADVNEYDTLSVNGFTGKGVDFWADPAYSNAGYPVYRLYSSTNGNHRWSSSGEDVANLVKSGYSVEGVAFAGISPVRQETPAPAGKALTYRFYVPQTYGHIWTNDINERDIMIQAGYRYEGIAWYSSASASDTPVFRLYSPLTRQHLYTTSQSERDNLNNTGGVWYYEGIAFYVSKTATATPVYRLYSPELRVHQLTTDGNERNVLVSSGHWNDEGVAWYQ